MFAPRQQIHACQTTAKRAADSPPNRRWADVFARMMPGTAESVRQSGDS